jgi:hypothetical protein
MKAPFAPPARCLVARERSAVIWRNLARGAAMRAAHDRDVDSPISAAARSVTGLRGRPEFDIRGRIFGARGRDPGGAAERVHA